MKILSTIVLVAIAFLMSSSQAMAAFASKTNWSWDASSRVRHEIHNNPAGTTGGSLSTRDFNFTEQKTTLGVNFNQGEAFRGRIGLIHAFNWGGTNSTTTNLSGEFNTPAGGNGSTVGSPNGVGDQQNLLLVNEAWLWWALSYSLSVSVGRGGLDLADGKVLSRNDDEITPTSFDGIMFRYDHDSVLVKLFGVKATDNFNPRTGTTQGVFTNDPETSFFGTAVDFKGLPEFIKNVNVHVFQVNSDAVGTNAQLEQTRYGLNLGGQISGLGYSATYAAHTGTAKSSLGEGDVKGNMIDLMARYDLPELSFLFFQLGFHTDTGDEDDGTNLDTETYRPFFYNRHENAGLMDVIEWGNLTYFYIGTGVRAWEIDFAVTYYMFSQTEENNDTNKGAHGSFLNGGAAIDTDGEDAIGSEIDFTATHQLDNGLNLGFRWGIFSPGDEFTVGQQETYSQYVFEMSMKF